MNSFFFVLFVIVLVTASPLGDPASFKRDHAGPRTRRYLLQSRLDSPAACVPLKPTTVPAVSNPTTSTNSIKVGNNSNTTDVKPPGRRRRAWKRIAQDDLEDVALSWQRLCLASGGDIFTLQPCVNLAGTGGINAILADAEPCGQQDVADAMVTFAKSAGVKNRKALIANAIAYRSHPRNALNILGVVPSTPYCQRPPKNPELNGVVNQQLEGVNPGLFGSPAIPIMPFGAPGTCPFGLTPDVATCTCVNKSSATAGVSSVASITVSDATITAAGNSTSIGSSVAATAKVTSSALATSVTSSATAQVKVTIATVVASATSVTSSTSKAISATQAKATNAASSTSRAISSANTGVTSVVASASSTSKIAPTSSTTSALVKSVAKAQVSPSATASKSAGQNIQPSDISGDVNDVNG